MVIRVLICSDFGSIFPSFFFLILVHLKELEQLVLLGFFTDVLHSFLLMF